MTAYLEIFLPDGTSERHRLDQADVRLGRAPRSGIAIPEALDLEEEHLAFAPRPEGCWVQTTPTARNPTLVGGVPHAAGLVPWGSEIVIGRVRFVLVAKREERERVLGVPVVLLAVVLLPLAAWMLLTRGSADPLPVPRIAPPALFAEPEACPDKGTGAAALARESAEAATAKAERYPFAPKDGIEAVALFGRAARCAGEAGQQDEATRLDALREAWKTKVATDFQTQRLRLERCLKERRYTEALDTVYVLLTYLEGRADPYSTWLIQLRRQLDLQLARTKRRS